MQRLFDTASLTLNQWLVCVAVASSIMWFEEVRKLVMRIVGSRSAKSTI
jgi:hypothetical protein